MASPPAGILPEAATNPIFAKAFTEELQKGLFAAAKSREEATPEPIYSSDNFEQPFRYLAELQRKHFTSREAKEIRQRITDLEYWKCEVQFCESTLSEFRGRARKVEEWRTLAKVYKSLLTRNGYHYEQLRYSISGQPYWQHEAEFLEQESNRREYKMKMRWKQQAQTGQPRSNSLTQTSDKVSNHTRSKTQSGGAVSSRTRSKTQARDA
ncbi:hypothetical protein V8C35DRAFT_266065 [Trichoderma chlorosporum]